MSGKRIAGIVLTVLGGIALFLTLILGGIFFALGSGINGISNQDEKKFEEFQKTAISCEGIVTYVDDDPARTVIEYVTEDGDSYKTAFNVVSSSYYEGTSVSVYYNMYDPTECMAPELTGEVTGLVGGIFSLVGGVFAAIFGIPGIILLIVGIVLIVKGKKVNYK